MARAKKKKGKNVTLSGFIVKKTAPIIASVLLTTALPFMAKIVADKKNGGQG